MTRKELDNKIRELTETADGLDEPDKTFKLNEVDRLKIEIEGMALQELRNKLEQIQLPDIEEMDEQIAAAKDATTAHKTRVDAFNAAIEILTAALNIAL